MDGFCKVKEGLLNKGISELSSSVLGGNIPR